MKSYIFTERNGIHIIDLQQTAKAMAEVQGVVRDTVARGGTILFVGTKRQAVETIEEEALRCGMPYVTFRWLGGMLTNWFTMRQRINELDRLERMKEKGEFELITKKEGLMLNRKIEKLIARFGGIRHMHKLPDMLFIVDIRREETAVREANTLGIPTIALVDTNCDPRQIDYVIPSNDDAIRTIKLMVSFIADAVEEGRAMRKDEDVEDVQPRRRAVREEELSDEDLLGASTLAKMEAAAETEDAVEEEEPVVEEKPVADSPKVKKSASAKVVEDDDNSDDEE
jgi:small subunit ribosomal protein S2